MLNIKEHIKDIFISYKNDGVGNNFATRLVEDLRKCGYSVYFDRDAIKSGDYEEKLLTAIEGCKDFVCIVTSEYLSDLFYAEKSVVRDELICAKKYGKKILPILVNETKMPSAGIGDHRELDFFATIHAHTFPSDYIESPFVILCDALSSNKDGINNYRDRYHSNPDFDPDKDFEEIIKSAEEGSDESIYCAGVYSFYGISGKQNYKEAAKWFLKLVDTDSKYAPLACKYIGRMYYQGCMPREPQSYEKSFFYHKKAAEKDDFSARHLASMMARGSGCEYDYCATEQYYLSIIDKCDNVGKMGFCEFYCKYGEFKKAAAICEKIAETYPNAAFQLGLMYKNGVLASPPCPDYYKAASYLRSAADKGHINSAYELAELYFNPVGNFPCDFAKAQQYYQIAADGGHESAQYVLGYMYEYGHVKKDLSKAIYYYEKAYAQGNVLSASHLGLLYQQPEIHNYERAFQCCKFSADAGDVPAEFVLGVLYLSGRGCDPDPDKAYMCFKHASECGTPEASMMLQKMKDNDL